MVVGTTDGVADGTLDGMAVGFALGITVGNTEGTVVGVRQVIVKGGPEGELLGCMVGITLVLGLVGYLES